MSADRDRDRPTDGRWPPGFDSWPRDAQLEHIRMTMTRKGLIAEMLAKAGMPPNQYDLRDDSKLRKKELAAIYLLVEGIDYEE